MEKERGTERKREGDRDPVIKRETDRLKDTEIDLQTLKDRNRITGRKRKSER